jgi:hypothetical protein
MKRRRMAMSLGAVTLLIGGFVGTTAASADPSSVSAEKVLEAYADYQRPAGVSPTAISWRQRWCGVHGRYLLHMRNLYPSNGHPVAVTISEADGDREFIGDAVMTVHNVVAWDGVVTARVNIDWQSDLCIFTHYVAQ